MKNILVEANCMWNIREENDKLIPKCCTMGPNNISINCLKFNEETHQHCPFLIFGTARSSMVLANQYGDVINSGVFWADLHLSEKEWIEKEAKWLEKQSLYISKEMDT